MFPVFLWGQSCAVQRRPAPRCCLQGQTARVLSCHIYRFTARLMVAYPQGSRHGASLPAAMWQSKT